MRCDSESGVSNRFRTDLQGKASHCARAAVRSALGRPAHAVLLSAVSNYGSSTTLRASDAVGSVDCTLSWKKVEAAQDLLQLFHEGQRNMVYAETKMNKHSSRSHAVLQVKPPVRLFGLARCSKWDVGSCDCSQSHITV